MGVHTAAPSLPSPPSVVLGEQEGADTELGMAVCVVPPTSTSSTTGAGVARRTHSAPGNAPKSSPRTKGAVPVLTSR